MPTRIPLFLLIALVGCAACGPEPADAPPVGQVTAAIGDPMPGEVAESTPAIATAAQPEAQVEFRLAQHEAREALRRDLAACDTLADPTACQEKALRAYDVAMADAGRRTGLRADEVVPLDLDVFAEGMPVVHAVGNRG